MSGVSILAGRSGRTGSHWPGFLLRRAVTLVAALWATCTFVFFMTALNSADAVRAAAGIAATPEYVAAQRHALGLDDPLVVQYGRFLAHAVRLDFGPTLSTGQPVTEVIGQRFPHTLVLGLTCFLIVAVAGLSLGMAVAVRAASKPHSRLNAAFNGFSGLLTVVPDYLVAVALILVFAVGLRALPAAGGDGVQAYVMPVATVSVSLTAVFARVVKSETTRVLREEYIRCARANRIPQWRLLLGHVLPNVVTATLTYAGIMLAGLMGGMLITETVFGFPGVGSLLVQAITLHDRNLMVGIVLLIASIALTVNVVVDVLIAALDPKSVIARS
ncbi:ABC transporter permease [Streptomyces sp. NPDC051985]|uniref:ABC transporter permease n=1 Tax=Streptomyces sp. NPDC051985 TaxID=3155807 RepID=UPI00343BBB8A